MFDAGPMSILQASVSRSPCNYTQMSRFSFFQQFILDLNENVRIEREEGRCGGSVNLLCEARYRPALILHVSLLDCEGPSNEVQPVRMKGLILI